MVASSVKHLPFMPSARGKKLTAPQLVELEKLIRENPPKDTYQLMLDEMRVVPGQSDIMDGLAANLAAAATQNDRNAARLEIRETYARLLPKGKYAAHNTRFLEQARQMELIK